jgi:hypothetical protein
MLRHLRLLSAHPPQEDYLLNHPVEFPLAGVPTDQTPVCSVFCDYAAVLALADGTITAVAIAPPYSAGRRNEACM